jgi:hypothetical protein
MTTTKDFRSQVKVGDRVVVSVERTGVVREVTADRLRYKTDDGYIYSMRTYDFDKLDVKPAPPTWQVGDVVKHTGDGTVFLRTPKGVWVSTLNSGPLFRDRDIELWHARGQIKLVHTNRAV